jgi:predicted transcriptional regulator
MTTTATQAQSAITQKALQKKWGATIIAAGYTAVPDILLRRMGALGLKPMEMIVLLQILTYWWEADNKPYPSKKAIASAIGCSEKAVQKTITRLQKLGFVARIERRRDADRSQTNIYDFAPLIQMLEPHAQEEVAKIEQARQAKDERIARMRRRGRPTLERVK